MAGDRRALARAITLIESTRPADRSGAEALIADLLPHSGRSIRLGVSGVPGVGKSTFIEALGMHVIERGHMLAVLAVDPSSPQSGGSILGDKTRMERLARTPAAFVRPSPSGGTLGGIARRTREAVLAAEAQGFDVIIIETVGVGQSETAVCELVDMFLLLLSPGAGDDLQGIKKGIVELADLIIVNKADGDLAADAARVRRDYISALSLLRAPTAHWRVDVTTCSALEGKGVTEVWDTVERFEKAQKDAGAFEARRAAQAKGWMWQEVEDGLMAELKANGDVRRALPGLERAVRDGTLSPGEGARRILGLFSGLQPPLE